MGFIAGEHGMSLWYNIILVVFTSWAHSLLYAKCQKWAFSNIPIIHVNLI